MITWWVIHKIILTVPNKWYITQMKYIVKNKYTVIAKQFLK